MQSYFYHKIKEISLILFGALLGSYLLFIEDILKSNYKLLIIFLIILLLVGVGFFEWLHGIYLKIWRWIYSKSKTVALYAPYDIDGNTASWVNLSIRQIEQKLHQQKIKFSRIYANNFAKYPVVVNPYGGVYPEIDISKLQALEIIFEYVNKGGIYVNIADVPFYYAFDKKLNRRIGTTPAVHPLTTAISFLSVKISEKLKVFVYPIDINNKCKLDYGPNKDRVFSLHAGYINFFDQEIVVSNMKCSPRVCIPYGRGWFVLSSLRICENNLDDLVKVVTKAIELIR